jgi:hypothetical protein
LAARPELAKPAEHTEPDFLAEAYLAGRGQPVSVATAEGLLDRDGRASDTRQDTAAKRYPAASVSAAAELDVARLGRAR